MNEFENFTPETEPAPAVIDEEPALIPEPPHPAYPTPPVPKPPRKEAGPIIAIVLCCSLLGGGLGAGGVLLAQHLTRENTQPAQALQEEPEAEKPGDGKPADSKPADKETGSTILEGDRESSVIDIVDIDTSRIMTPAEVYAVNVGSTVGITTSITTNFWGIPSTAAASGSGFIISDDGYILTNFHVIDDSDSITVSLYNGDEYDAKLIGFDESNDIAVLKIEAEGLIPVILGDSDNLNVGDTVLAIGNPLGELTFSLTTGVISAKGREVSFSNGVTMDLLQTDCAINSGNSGGALFNLYGEVIGVTNAKYSSSSSSEASIDNIGFAIPLNSIRGIVESIIEKGYISKPYIGVSVTDVSAELQSYGLPAGAAVQSVTADGPAAKAGLQAGDIITKAGDTEITGSGALVDLVGKSEAGDTLELTVYRKGKTISITVTIEEQIQSALEKEEPETGGSGLYPWGGW